MINDVLKAAVGIGLRKLRATQDTFLKRSPVQSSDLVDTEKDRIYYYERAKDVI
jgi:hypothetical protein